MQKRNQETVTLETRKNKQKQTFQDQNRVTKNEFVYTN